MLSEQVLGERLIGIAGLFLSTINLFHSHPLVVGNQVLVQRLQLAYEFYNYFINLFGVKYLCLLDDSSYTKHLM